jgi:hypothetical protein
VSSPKSLCKSVRVYSAHSRTRQDHSDCRLSRNREKPSRDLDEADIQIEALKLHNKDGTEHNFPANMQRHMPLEAFDDRIKRIAALDMAAGSIIKSDARQIIKWDDRQANRGLAHG